MGQFQFSNGSVLPYSGLSVAIVDDDEQLRTGLSRLLEMSGMTVEQYGSGEAFLDAAATSQADCVVIDIMLGDLTGFEVVQHLEASQPFPIVFITGSPDPLYEQQADRIAGAAFLRKPFLRDTLIEAILAAIDSRAQRDADMARDFDDAVADPHAE